MTAKIAKLVRFGRGRDTVEYGGGCVGQGYGTPERPHAAQPDDDCIIPDGTPAIDKRPALDTPEGYRWGFEGPMVNVDLPEGEREDCPEPSDIVAAELTLTSRNQYAQLLALQAAHRATSEAPGPLDKVSIGEYVAGWRAVGARIGHYAKNEIIWED